MSDDTRRLLRDAAPPVSAGTDFDRLWEQAARQRRLQRAGQAAAAVVLIALAGLAGPFGWGGSLPTLGRGDADRVEVEPLPLYGPVSAPLSEWDVVWTPGSRGGPVLTGSTEGHAVAVFAIEGGRWCIAAVPPEVRHRFDAGPIDPTVAERLLCHEVRPPHGDDPVGTVVAIELGERLVHVAVAPGTDELPPVRVDDGSGFEHVTEAFAASAGGVPFTVWSTASIHERPVAFEFSSPAGGAEPLTVEAPEPVPAEVEG